MPEISAPPETYVAVVQPQEQEPVRLFAPFMENPREVVLQLDSRSEKSAASVVIQMPDRIPPPPDDTTSSFREKFKDRNPLLLGAWATAMLSYLVSHQLGEEGWDYATKMHFGSTAIGVSFVAWLVLLFISETTTAIDPFKKLLVFGKFAVVGLYSLCYGGALLGLGVAFSTVYLPTSTHELIQALIFAGIILVAFAALIRKVCCGKDDVEATNEKKKTEPPEEDVAVAGGGRDAVIEMAAGSSGERDETPFLQSSFLYGQFPYKRFH